MARRTQFVKANAPFAADVPLESGQGLQLVGARLTQVDGRVAVIYQYDKAGQRVSVLQAVGATEETSTAASSSRLDHRQGYGVLTFGSRGSTTRSWVNSRDGNARLGAGKLSALDGRSWSA